MHVYVVLGEAEKTKLTSKYEVQIKHHTHGPCMRNHRNNTARGGTIYNPRWPKYTAQPQYIRTCCYSSKVNTDYSSSTRENWKRIKPYRIILAGTRVRVRSSEQRPRRPNIKKRNERDKKRQKNGRARRQNMYTS